MQQKESIANQNPTRNHVHHSSRSKRKYNRDTCLLNTSNTASQRNPSQSLFDLSSQAHSLADKDNINHYALSRSPNSIIFITALFYFSQKCHYPQQDNVLFRFLKKDFENQHKTATFITSDAKIESVKENQTQLFNKNILTSNKSIEDKFQILNATSNQSAVMGQIIFKNQIKFAPFNAKNILNHSNIQKLLQKINRCLKQQKNIYNLLHQNYEIQIFLTILARQYAINYLESHLKKYKEDSFGNQLQILQNYESQPRNLVLTIIMDSLGIQTSFLAQGSPQNDYKSAYEQKIGDSKNRLKFEIKSLLIDEQICYVFAINFNDPHKNKISRLIRRQKSIDYNRPNINSLYTNFTNNQYQNKLREPLSPTNNRNIKAALSPKKKYSIPFSIKNQENKIESINIVVPAPLGNIKKTVQKKLMKSSELHSQGKKQDVNLPEIMQQTLQTPAKLKDIIQGNCFSKKKSPTICNNCAQNKQFCSCLQTGANFQNGKFLHNQKKCAILNISSDKNYNLLSNYRA